MLLLCEQQASEATKVNNNTFAANNIFGFWCSALLGVVEYADVDP
jgi:hypothetical protein